MMLRNGKPLTTEELAEIALARGLTTERDLEALRGARHNANRFRSDLLDMTREVRHEMFWAGELDLSMSTERNSPPRRRT